MLPRAIGRAKPMVEKVTQRFGQAPEAWLVDGCFTTHEQIDQAGGRDCEPAFAQLVGDAHLTEGGLRASNPSYCRLDSHCRAAWRTPAGRPWRG